MKAVYVSLNANAGLAIAAAQTATAIRAAGVEVRRATLDTDQWPEDMEHGLVVHHFHPDFPRADHVPFGTKTIGYWAWETEGGMPAAWASWARCYSELWVPSEFVRAQVHEIAPDVPVCVIPHSVKCPQATAAEWTGEGTFTVLTSFDGKSRILRKNPLGIAEAFRQAFTSADAARLVVKCHDCPPSLEQRLRAIVGDQLEFIDGFVPEADMLHIMRRAHVFLSLHRGEGFGLHLLEAMAAGVPVISTAFGGCLDFQTNENALLVPGLLVPATDAYYRTGVWAEPNTATAARYLRQCREDWPHQLVARARITALEWGITRQHAAVQARIDTLLGQA